LPSTLPLLSVIVSANLGQRSLWLIQAIFILGYALIWTIFALVAFFGDMLIHQLVTRWFWLYEHSWLIGITVLIIAAIFQFSPFKRYFLKCCQTTCNVDPQSHHQIKPWHFALQYGCYCVGSCWALMLIMFAIGMKNILYISTLSILILIEKTIPVGQPIRHFIGITFLILATVWLSLASQV
ncbi:MAG TPA: DUF2182 domain-containing protein, partial [Ktedonobacteraceae bacterium]|nr:DUF2182 domain-containing protein [Ktedonobacteraceae bacterium]